MTTDLNLSGPTVTVFGAHDLVDAALSDELGRRGCSTHSVTVPTGWLNSVTHAVIRLDTPAGERAIEELTGQQTKATHVVAVCATRDDATSARLDQLCQDAGKLHDISVIWYPPLELALDDDGLNVVVAPAELAVTIVDEIGLQEAWREAPSYATRTIEHSRHRGHA
jgi:hypothetical protein